MSINTSIYQFAKLIFNSCYACSSQLLIDDSGFCPRCRDRLFSEFKTANQNTNQTTLFDWHPNINRPLSLLLTDMKSGKSPKMSYYYGLKLFAEFLSQRNISQTWLIVPAPARNFCEKDHAYLLAQTIHKLTNWPLLPVLKRDNANPQRQKNKWDRELLQMSIFERFSLADFAEKPILFVDDIITTGSTAQAASRALGSPKNYHSLAIAHRRLLPN